MSNGPEPEELHTFNFEALGRTLGELRAFANVEGRRISLNPEDYERFKVQCISGKPTDRLSASAFGTDIEVDKKVSDGYFLIDGKPYKWAR